MCILHMYVCKVLLESMAMILHQSSKASLIVMSSWIKWAPSNGPLPGSRQTTCWDSETFHRRGLFLGESHPAFAGPPWQMFFSNSDPLKCNQGPLSFASRHRLPLVGYHIFIHPSHHPGGSHGLAGSFSSEKSSLGGKSGAQYDRESKARDSDASRRVPATQ